MKVIRRILAAVDFSEPSKSALRYAMDLGATLDAPVDVLHAWAFREHRTTTPELVSPGPEGPPPAEDAVQREAWRAFDAFVDDALEDNPLQPERHLVLGTPEEAILETAAKCGSNLIVIASHGAPAHPKLGRVAKAIMRQATCPVLVVPAG